MAKKYIREEDLSGGFKVPEMGESVGMSTCSVCKNRLWEGDWKCKVYGDCLKEIKEKMLQNALLRI